MQNHTISNYNLYEKKNYFCFQILQENATPLLLNAIAKEYPYFQNILLYKR